MAAGSDLRGQSKGLFLRGMNAQQFVSNDRPIFLALKKHLSDNWPLLEKETALIFFLAVKIFQLLTGGRHESPQQRNWNPNFFSWFFLIIHSS